MGETKIEWTWTMLPDGSFAPGFTFNGWIGCTEVAPECDNCYARTLDKRWGNDRWGVGKPRGFTSEANWKKPHQWNRLAEKLGVPLKVFAFSMADVFDVEVPDGWRDRFFLDVVAKTPWLRWLVLTKRGSKMLSYVREFGERFGAERREVFKTAWWGVTAGTQRTLDAQVPLALRVRDYVGEQAIVWVSVEPQLEALNVAPYVYPSDVFGHHARGVDWFVSGGESGPHARDYRYEFVLALIAQTDPAMSTPPWDRDRRLASVFVKQVGARFIAYSATTDSIVNWNKAGLIRHAKGADPTEWPPAIRIREFPEDPIKMTIAHSTSATASAKASSRKPSSAR